MVEMIPVLQLSDPRQRELVEKLLDALRLKPQDFIAGHSKSAAAVEQILQDVATRGDEAIVESARQFDDPSFTAEEIRVAPAEMKSAISRVSDEIMAALRRSIAQVREYQTHILPQAPATLS